MKFSLKQSSADQESFQFSEHTGNVLLLFLSFHISSKMQT